MPLNSAPRENHRETLVLPSMLETFKAARELIGFRALASPTRREQATDSRPPAVKRHIMPLYGKPEMMMLLAE